MKKLLIVSLALNAVLILGFSIRRIRGNRAVQQSEQTQKAVRDTWASCRADLYNSLAVDSNDIVFIGTSLTEGFPVSEYFPGVKNRGVGWNESKHILSRIDQVRNAKLVFLEVGTNDVLDGVPADTLQCNCEKILAALKNRVLVQLVNNTPKITQANNRLRNYCMQNAIPCIDIDIKGQTCDSLHPNKKGYELWRDKIVKYVK
jgi:lysophospholipase L1-like esterase